MAKQIIAGISLSGDVAHLAIFEMRSHEVRLLHLEEYQKNNSNELWFLDMFNDSKNRILKDVSKVSIALDLNSSIIHLFPMDTTLDHTEQNEHVHWELSNIVPEYESKDYVHDIHTLDIQSHEQVANVLVVAVKRSLLSQIQDALNAKGLELHIADTSFFGAEQAFTYNYPESKFKPFALIHSAERRVDIGIEVDSKLVQYGYTLSNFPDDIIQLLRRLSSGINLEKILCCGPLVLPHFNHLIQDATGISVEMFNPFRLQIKTSTFSDFKNFNNSIQRYAAATGVALWK
jgi:Tfp pilus assembly PilM family ATPase